MSAPAIDLPQAGADDDVVCGYLASVQQALAALVEGEAEASEAVRVDRIALLERLKAAAAAAQAAEIVRFARSRVEAQKADRVDYRKLGRGLGDEIGLATKVGPWGGSRRLTLARDLVCDLPSTYALLTAGRISEDVASRVADETRHLEAEQRQQVDADLAPGLEALAPKAAAAAARRAAYAADPAGSLRRGRTARKQRRVTLRPAPDTMSVLSGLLPVEQGVACYAALRQHADAVVATGDGRSRDQVMADTLVERLTGQQAADDVDVEVQLTMPLDSLLDPDATAAATLAGHGPIPAWLAHHLLRTGQGRTWWRRLFTMPAGASAGAEDAGGHDTFLVGGDPVRRRFDGWLAKLIALRDQVCRDPYCNAAIRHLDHIVPYRDGGPTTLANGRGVCARGNYVRELPGWQVRLVSPGTDQPHAVEIITPTGHRYHSRAPDPP